MHVFFQVHMETVHKCHFHLDILLAVNAMNREERNEIIEKFNKKVSFLNKNGGEKVIMQPAKSSDKNSFKTEITLVKKEVIWEDKYAVNEDISLDNSISIINENKMSITNPITLPNNTQSGIFHCISPPLVKTELLGETFPLLIWTCHKCDKILQSQSDLKKHEESKIPCNNICRKCRKLFINTAKLKSHIENKKSCVKNVYKCEDCPKEFRRSQLLDIHKERRRTCKTNVSFKCTNCLNRFNSKSVLTAHYSRNTKCLKKLFCTNCSKKVFESNFENHSKKCFNAEDLKCPHCLKIFANRSSARNHYKNRKTNPQFSGCREKWDCNKCGKKFKEDKLKTHLQLCGSTKEISRCPNCLKMCSSITTARKHKARLTCKKKMSCSNCCVIFNEQQYTEHIRNKCFKYSCEGCGSIFSDEKYKEHLQQKCDFFLTCENCQDISMDRKSAMRHKVKGLCKKIYTCTKCNKKFLKKEYTHHLGKNCATTECERCGEKFTASQLKKHMKRKRACNSLGIKCNICLVLLVNTKTLTKHMQKVHQQRIEDKKKNLLCFACKRLFRLKSNLVKHQQRKKECSVQHTDIVY